MKTTCRYCAKECKNSNSWRNHERLCKCNPDRQISDTSRATGAAKRRIRETLECEYCKSDIDKQWLYRHKNSCRFRPENKKVCVCCEKDFYPKGDNITCGRSCSNTYFLDKRIQGYIDNDNANYRTICFHYHTKKCLICGEENIVSVHHLNEDHHDDRPENLIPLCPTHHQYLHSRYKKEIEDKVARYIKDFIDKR